MRLKKGTKPNPNGTNRLFNVTTTEGKFIAFSVDQKVDQKNKIQSNKIVLVDFNDEVIFSITNYEAKNLLKQLKFSISMCEYFNLLENKTPF